MTVVDDAYLSTVDQLESFQMPYFPERNQVQEKATNDALHQPFTVIQGPPGTGKTIVGVQIAYLFALINRKLSSTCKVNSIRPQVLCCGPSDKSVDILASKCHRLTYIDIKVACFITARCQHCIKWIIIMFMALKYKSICLWMFGDKLLELHVMEYKLMNCGETILASVFHVYLYRLTLAASYMASTSCWANGAQNWQNLENIQIQFTPLTVSVCSTSLWNSGAWWKCWTYFYHGALLLDL